ncbi:MAG: large-conductance mechanosensitive channel protein MscL [Fusobacteriaceae bacterium]|jgi:large conductance mechanosensitive channel|nr:large-conductance mechanosensitive channel protein MscL [Fusobacteriaceae bacterium]
MWKEFKDFAFKGNVIDMAVGVIIGGAFGKIVSSVVNDLMMPILGKILGGFNFSDLKCVLTAAVLNEQGEVVTPENAIYYGRFFQNVIDFLIIAFCIFLFVKTINTLRRKKEEAPPAPAGPTTEDLLTEIRDLLKK